MLKININNDNFNWPLFRQILSLSLYANKPVEIIGSMNHVNQNQLLPLYDDLKKLIQEIKAGSIDEKNDSIVYNPENIDFGILNYKSNKFSSILEVALFLLPSLLHKDFRSVLNLNGVTHSHLSYPTVYLKNNILSLLEKINFIGSLTLKRFGFYGSGGGEAEIRIYPFNGEKKKRTFTPGKLKIVGARIIISGLNTDLAKNEKKYIMDALSLQDKDVSILEVRDSDGPGNSIQIFISEDDDLENPLVLHSSLRVVDELGNIILNSDDINISLENLLKKARSCIIDKAYPSDLIQEMLPYCLITKSRITIDSKNVFLSNARDIFSEFI